MTPDRLTLSIEKPAAGGRMVARLDGRIVLVAGAIPGERVVARVERARGDVIFAVVDEVLEASPHRRSDNPDPACGGMTFSHIDADAQRAIKADIVRDAFARIGKLAIEVAGVHASPPTAYRMRARVHVRGGRLGSFREGTHDVCDVALTRQLRDDTVEVLRAVEAIGTTCGVTRIDAIEVAENIDASERVLHVDPSPGVTLPPAWLEAVGAIAGVSGLTVAASTRRTTLVSGQAVVGDPLAAYVQPSAPGRIERRGRSFFQANRFLTPVLARALVGRLTFPSVIDLYAGVGLFALAAAASGATDVTAIEGDPFSAEDLDRNAGRLGQRVRVVHAAVEDAVRARRAGDDTSVIVDPPRTGMSKAALDGVLAWRARQVIYVSCDVATVARDARRFVDAGYRASAVDVFDMFPNTPHVETLIAFTRD